LLSQIMSEIARLSVEIDDVTPRVLRVVEVPTDIRLDDLHFVLQIAIGWQNGHPFEFRIGDKLWGQPDRDADVSPTPAEGRCPPADIGGPVGYETYLRSIADPNSVDHEDMLDFDAPDFDPHVVDAATLRQNLADLTRYIGRKPHSHGAAGS
jgi:hypothetical protein